MPGILSLKNTGHPAAAAAVVAAPMRKECDEYGVLAEVGSVVLRNVLSRRRVKYDPSAYVNNGPFYVG